MESGGLPPVTSQPNSGFSAPGAPGSGSEVTIRNLTNSAEDCAFAGKLCVEGFRNKMIHATSERALPALIDGMGKLYEGQDPEFFENYYIAEYRNEKAGLMVIKYHDTPHEKDNGALKDLGCCNLCGLACLFITLDFPVPQSTCLIDCLAVDEKFRGKGIGKQFLDRAEYEGKKRSCKMMSLYVMSTNRAIHLYERQGYEVKDSKCCCMICATGESKALRMDKPLL